MNNKKIFNFIDLKYHKDKRGILLPVEDRRSKNNSLPIDFKRIFVLEGLNPKETRGNHALKKTTQILIALMGKCDIVVDNGVTKKTIKLDKINKGIIIYPMVWRVLKNFSKDAVILVIADSYFLEKDYIRNYEDFIQQIRKGISKK